jgi:type II secretory pathway pseudopilin PulG
MPPRRPRHQQGLTYLALLFLVAILSVGLSVTGVVWQTALQRTKEQELLFIGDQFRFAIASYYHATPGVKRHPPALTDLIKDPRFPNVRRHLRQIYPDPVTGKREWGTVRSADGGILGVYSLSDRTTIRVSFPFGPNKDFTGKQRYLDWKFVYLPVVTGQAPVVPTPIKRPESVRQAGVVE